jgi:PPM family protein phosphatase
MKSDAGLEFAVQTDTGLVRSHNEDSVAISPVYGFAILADGMGGYSAGEVASSMATSMLKAALEEGLDRLQHRANLSLQRNRQIHQLLIDSIQDVNSTVLAAARANSQYNGMGTTLVTALFHGDKITVAHVGDSRAYRFRQGELVQLTRDHSLLQEQIDSGLVNPEWARFAQNKNLVTRAVGVGPYLEVEVHDRHTKPGDVYLLCSDGMSDMLAVEEIIYLLTNCGPSLEATCNALVQQANHSGGYDNISVVLVVVHHDTIEVNGLFARILRLVKRCGWRAEV